MMDDRAVSTTVGYALTLSITTLLITGLIFAGGGYVETQREQSIRNQLNVVGNQLAGDIEGADRLAAEGSTVVVTRELPERVGGASYVATVGNDADGYFVELSSNNPDVTVTVDLNVDNPVSGSVSGGRVTITLAGGTLEVTDG